MLVELDHRAAHALLGSMVTVATAGGRDQLSERASVAVESLAELGLGRTAPAVSWAHRASPENLSASLPDRDAATTAVEILAVTALVDGSLDSTKIEQVLAFANACGVSEHWLDDLSRSTKPDLGPVIADMSDQNLRSITDGRLDLAQIGDVNEWLLPYEGDRRDVGLVARYEELRGLDEGSLGREFWAFYDRHHFSFPGEPGAANELFTTPHDTTHLLSAYDTTPQGELLVSTFTARMHPVNPMEGHILPVIYSWHLGIEFNKLAGSYRGALDPAKFWVAWDRGLQAKQDTFADGFDFWGHVEEPLEDLRQAFGIPSLDPRHAAHSDARPGIDYTPIA